MPRVCTRRWRFRLAAPNYTVCVCRSFDLPQDAAAFNQPLSFDTSSVTSMIAMFLVRLALSTIQLLPSLFPS